MFNAVPDTMSDMSLQHNLTCLIERGFRSIYLRKDILAGDIFIDHPVDGLDLSYDLCKPAVQVRGIHTLFHIPVLHTIRGICIIAIHKKKVNFYSSGSRASSFALKEIERGVSIRSNWTICAFFARSTSTTVPSPKRK